MPYQEAIVQQPHASAAGITAAAGTGGTAVIFRGATNAYDAEVTNAELAGLVVGTTYNVTGLFTGIGNPTVSLNGVKGTFDLELFDIGAAAVYGVGAATLTNAGSGGRWGQYVLVMPAPLSSGVTVTQQAAGYFVVSPSGVVSQIVVTLPGAGYATAGAATLAMTAAMFAQCPGLTGVAGSFALPSVGTASAI